MGIHNFFDKQVIISSLKATGEADRTRFNTTATVDAAIQELDGQARTELGLSQDRAWICYADISQEKLFIEGNKITFDGVTYKVIERTKKDYRGSANQHLQIILIEYPSE